MSRFGAGVTASAVRCKPTAIQGCRPNSVTNQPASSAISASGPVSAIAIASHFGGSLRRIADGTQASAMMNSSVAEPIMASNDRCVAAIGGLFSGGMASSPAHLRTGIESDEETQEFGNFDSYSRAHLWSGFHRR